MKLTEFFYLRYFAKSVRKGISRVGSIFYVKNDFIVSKILKSTVLDKSSNIFNVFALNLQSTLSLKKIR